MTAEALKRLLAAYQDFYRWSSILKGAWAKDDAAASYDTSLMRPAKFEPLWDWVIQPGGYQLLPALEAVLAGWGRAFRRPRASRTMMSGNTRCPNTI
jgi:hypothetical protein